MYISNQSFLTKDASYTAWNGDPESFPEVDSITVWIAPIVVAVATRLNTVIDGNDGKVDEEDDRKSDKQHREAFYRAVNNYDIKFSGQECIFKVFLSLHKNVHLDTQVILATEGLLQSIVATDKRAGLEYVLWVTCLGPPMLISNPFTWAALGRINEIRANWNDLYDTAALSWVKIKNVEHWCQKPMNIRDWLWHLTYIIMWIAPIESFKLASYESRCIYVLIKDSLSNILEHNIQPVSYLHV